MMENRCKNVCDQSGDRIELSKIALRRLFKTNATNKETTLKKSSVLLLLIILCGEKCNRCFCKLLRCKNFQ